MALTMPARACARCGEPLEHGRRRNARYHRGCLRLARTERENNGYDAQATQRFWDGYRSVQRPETRRGLAHAA